jgi:hypothetical protein
MHEIPGQNIGSGTIKFIHLIQVQVVTEDLKHIRAALSDIVRQEFNPVRAHYRQLSVMTSLKLEFAELHLYGGQFTLQDGNKKVPASAGRLQKTRVNALSLAVHQVKHFFD